ncbi:twin-arginine translocase TatA/TatE family subunit [Pyxidicoccus parkwayensis]|uniref:Twin-arginine translocase TatA/TatE family subunit n=1 Tax=Pyxidicoccus parkwayensis TaxID=2813578 RepID=A0ABX7P196_9BACT|nr:twin-arginine translocase TatA/TatE family subunit [Pyxidicoccus parkwaysis]QSQ23632.1 twin-arginine translocase TatA/TatE family subunit [Pyxidicoccus parkwaysis]
MFNIGAGEMVLIAVAALLILGPKRLPELARGLGKFMREFRRQTDEVRNVVEREFYSLDTDVSAPPVRPGSPFANTPPPSSVSLPEAPAIPPDAATASPEAPAIPPDAAAPAPAPAPGATTQVLELDASGPRPAEPSFLREPQAPAPAEPAALTPDTPVPVPGTVARNAPKRS